MYGDETCVSTLCCRSKVSGREVFQFRPELAQADADDDEMTEDISQYKRQEEVRDIEFAL